ncbi:hypothetical protein [Tychonema sp. BBK16]|uniref:hypothetical protein n=1 Tax=Tychonema sp. BBK16 TaxID=2699888 RepID=UPI001F451095|nr:hypothetical protein [Tychonema sp. BBK16]MCF6371802.1 hypothetical protein [Tychonema sp. BBK16]
MIYRDIPLIIPILATGYVMTIYLLLILAQRSAKITRLNGWRFPEAESRSSVR